MSTVIKGYVSALIDRLTSGNCDDTEYIYKLNYIDPKYASKIISAMWMYIEENGFDETDAIKTIAQELLTWED